MGIDGISKSEVSRLCASLDAEFEAFRRRPLTDLAFPYLWLDATYLKVREAGRVVSMTALVATGVAMTGERRVLGLELSPAMTRAPLASSIAPEAIVDFEDGRLIEFVAAPLPSG